jgi:23S rRNA (cytosine1962-C5)-methyltransferase
VTPSNADPPRVVLAKNLARSIRRGHPWLYRDALRPGPALPEGQPVTVSAPDGRPLARGFWDARSAIAVRIVDVEARGPGASARPRELPSVLEDRVQAALDRRLGTIDRGRTDAFRVVHGEADGLPGVHADLYRDAVTLRFDGAGARAFYLDPRHRLPALLAAAGARRSIPIAAVLERRRGPRPDGDGDKPGTTPSSEANGDGAALPLIGDIPAGEIEVRENGLRFGVDLRHGQKGGLFLDQRDNREHVRSLAAGKRVLNLFGYTGGFSIYAAAGGAARTTTVDVAREALAAARRNFQRNALPVGDDAVELLAEDAFLFLERAVRDRSTFDLVISDPPSFAPSRKALPAALRAYRRLHRLCATVVAPGGVLCAASCSSHVGRDEFLATVEAGATDAGRRWVLQAMRGAAADHPVVPQFPEGDYLKFAVGRL